MPTASRAISEKSLANQRLAIERREQAAKMIRRIGRFFALIVIAGLIIFLVKLRMENYPY